MGLWDLPVNEAEAIKFLQERGILHEKRTCNNNHDMKLYFGNERHFWKCNLRTCRQSIGLRKDNWCENKHLPFVKMIRFIYLWSRDLTSISFCMDELKISNKTIIDWNNYLEEICILEMTSKIQERIGGPGKIVEIGESLYKRRNTCGLVLPEQWLFGGICQETKESFLILIPYRNADTLLREIFLNIKEESMIIADCLESYEIDELDKAGFSQFKDNHKFNFIERNSVAHAQHIGNYWGLAKWRNRKRKINVGNYEESTVAEFMWKDNKKHQKLDFFDSILSGISKHFPPVIKSPCVN